jgi:hypothetical protein
MAPALVDKNGIAFFTTTPRGFDWCYKRLWLPAQKGTPGFWALQYKTIDNPKINKVLVEQQRQQVDALWFQQEYEASFVNFTGSIYDIEKQILRDEDAIKRVIPEWPKLNPERETILGMDPGADHPFAATLLVKTERGLVCVGEYSRRNLLISEHVRNISNLLGSFNTDRPFQPTYAIDRSQKQTAIELSAYGIFASGADNNVVNGIRRIQSWLAAGQLFFVESATPLLIEKLRAYRWAENFTPDGEAKNRETVIKEDDDLPDALRYAVMTWPELPEVNVQPSAGQRDYTLLDEKQRYDLERITRIARRERGEDVEDEYDSETSVLVGNGQAAIGDFWGAPSERAMFGDEE